jgi:uncharacterized protein YebE (UPF0316 family)
MEIISWSMALGGVVIFCLRVCDVTMDTIRLIYLTRGRKYLAAFLGFCQALIFILAISAVLRNGTNWYNIIGYCAGFATGNIVGVSLEERIAMGFALLRAFTSAEKGPEIADALRAQDFGVTETFGQGRNGYVTIVESVVRRRDVPRVQQIIAGIDDKTFVVIDEARSIFQGYLRKGW